MSAAIANRQTVVTSAVVIALLVLGAGVWLWAARSEGARLRADAADARQVALGEAVYRRRCASCHGAKLEGQPDWRIRKPDGKLPAPPHDESGHTWHHPDGQLFRITKLGLKPPLAPEGYRSDMPSFGTVLTDEEIWAALAFIKSRWPAEIRARHGALNQRASQ